MNWWILDRVFDFGILSFLIFLILGQVLELTIAQEGRVLFLCLGSGFIWEKG